VSCADRRSPREERDLSAPRPHRSPDGAALARWDAPSMTLTTIFIICAAMIIIGIASNVVTR
jgi:hypothetical protein